MKSELIICDRDLNVKKGGVMAKIYKKILKEELFKVIEPITHVNLAGSTHE